MSCVVKSLRLLTIWYLSGWSSVFVASKGLKTNDWFPCSNVFWHFVSLRGSLNETFEDAACKAKMIKTSKPNMIWNTKYHLWHHLGPQSSRHLNLITQKLWASRRNHIDVYSHTSKTLRHGKIYYHHVISKLEFSFYEKKVIVQNSYFYFEVGKIISFGLLF